MHGFKFNGGSMGSVMGEKISRAIDQAIKLKCPFMIISKSGGARMMEAGFFFNANGKVSGNWDAAKKQIALYLLFSRPNYGVAQLPLICYARRFRRLLNQTP